MKKLILIFLFVIFALAGSAQSINGKSIKDIDVDYVQIVGFSKLFSTQLVINLDFGQESNFWNQKDMRINDATGKAIVFNSMIDALNFMSANGFEFVQAYAFAMGNQSVYHYLLRKKK